MLLPVYGKLFTKLHRTIFALINLFSYPDNNYISNKLPNPVFLCIKAFSLRIFPLTLDRHYLSTII